MVGKGIKNFTLLTKAHVGLLDLTFLLSFRACMSAVLGYGTIINTAVYPNLHEHKHTLTPLLAKVPVLT